MRLEPKGDNYLRWVRESYDEANRSRDTAQQQVKGPYMPGDPAADPAGEPPVTLPVSEQVKVNKRLLKRNQELKEMYLRERDRRLEARSIANEDYRTLLDIRKTLKKIAEQMCFDNEGTPETRDRLIILADYGAYREN